MEDKNRIISSWVNLYTDDLLAWANYKTKQPELSEDFVQETFIAAYKNFDKFKGNSSPKTWLFSILKNKIADYYRSKFKKSMLRESDLSKDDPESILDRLFDSNGDWMTSARPNNWEETSEELLDNDDFNNVLKDCIDNLNEKSTIAIQLKYIEGKEGKQICQELNITPSNFWQILHRAKLQLRECIDFNWFK